MRHLFGVTAAVVVVAALPVHAAAPVHHTGLGIKLLDAPAALIKDPRAHSYIIDNVGPGTKIVRHVEVTNDTGSFQHVSLYDDAAAITRGTFTPLAGHSTNELTSWTTVTPSSFDLQQGERATATVTIQVPNSAARGERYGVIFAEMAGRTVKQGFSVTSRVGVRTYLYVGRGAAPPSDFKILTIAAARTPDGHPVVTSAVRNVGGRALDMVGELWLRKGPGGLSAGPFPVQLGTTLGVGQTEPVTVVLDKALPAGPWLAHLELQSDLVKHAAEATVTFPTANGTSAAPVTAKAVPLTKNRNVLVPAALGLILALLIGLVLFLLWKRRRRRDDEDEEQKTDAEPPAVPGQRESRADEAINRLRR